MYVKRLKEILQNAINQLDLYPGDYEVDTHPNDYGLDNPVLQVYDGFIQLDDIGASPAED